MHAKAFVPWFMGNKDLAALCLSGILGIHLHFHRYAAAQDTGNIHLAMQPLCK